MQPYCSAPMSSSMMGCMPPATTIEHGEARVWMPQRDGRDGMDATAKQVPGGGGGGGSSIRTEWGARGARSGAQGGGGGGRMGIPPTGR